MNKFLFLTVSLLQVICVLCLQPDGDVYCKTVNVPDFYWREYNGAIPYDAIDGGKDRLGRPIYVGQAAIYKIGNIPASIYQDNLTAVTSSAETYYANKHVKILCSSNSSHKFKWIATDTDDMSLITNCLIVNGGLDYEDDAYIARVQYQGEVKIGKVLKKWNGILIPDNKGTEIIIKKFELLVFDCKDKETNVLL